MATEIGFIKALIGTATATAVDGSQRNLLVGDRINADEIITTGDASAIEIEFSDGSLMDLGRNSQAFLDTEIFDPQQVITSDSDVDITALQDALVAGEDPTQQGEATAAGAESEGNEGITTVVVEREGLTVEVTSGFETSGPTGSFLDDSSLFGGLDENTSDSGSLVPIIAPPTTTPISTQSNNDSDAINFNVSGNFSGSGLTFSAVGLPSNLSINPVTGIISGTLDSSASQSGPYNATITATDTASNSISQSFSWNVANPAPEADDDSASLNEDSTHNGSVASNDHDPDGDSVSFSLNSNTSNGALIFNNDGSYTYTPTANFNGTDTFTYTITDADGATDTATVTLTIDPQDDPTVTISDIGNTDEDTTLSVNAANGVLGNDSDIDDVLSVATFQITGDITTYTANSTATIVGVGALTINSDGGYLFTPVADYDGVVPVASYTTNTGATDTLSISITGINDAPMAVAAAGSFDEDQLSEPAVPQTGGENLLDNLTDVDDATGHFIGTVSDDGGSYQAIASNGSTQIKVEFDFTDKNGDPQTIYIPVLVDADGEYHVSQNGLLDAIPVGSAATGSFFYQINDGHAVNNLSAPQEFTITINGENDAPEFNVTSLANDGDIPIIVKLSGDSFNTSGQDAPRFIVSVDGVALNGGNALTIEELRSYNIDTPLGSEARETSWEYVTFNVPAGTTSVAIQFVNDAWEGGSDNDGDGYAEDRNLIIDYVNVGGQITGSGDAVTVTGGTTLQAEDPAVSTYLTSSGSDRSGREVMPWAGTMTFDVTNAVNNAVPVNAFQTESFAEDTLSSQASVTGTVSLLEGVSDIDDVISVITVGTVNGNAGTVGSPFNLDLSYDDGSGPQIITVQVTVAASGSYQLSNTAALDALPDGVIANGSFQFQAQDDSNDLSETQTFTINVLGDNDAPTIVIDTGNPANANDVVLESGLTSGSSPLLADRTAQGSFTIADADGLSDITSLAVGGTTFVIGTGVGEFADFAAMVGQTVSTPSGEVTLSGYNNGTFTYSYELTSATTDAPAAVETDSFDITVSDASGSALATVTIEIADDVPTITENARMTITHDETVGIDGDADDVVLPPPILSSGPISNPAGVAEVNLSSLITFNAGADGLQSISFTDAVGTALSHVDSGLTNLQGETIYLHTQPDGSIVGMADPDPSLIYIEGPPVVFTLVIDSSGAEPVVRFNQFLPIQHPDDTNADETVSITDLIHISVTDGDGDVATTTNALTVSIQDDAPILTADTNASDAVKEDVDTSSQGNVLTNDVSFDGNVVSSVQFGVTTEAIAAGSFAVIDGTYGSLLSNSDGVYSYTLNGTNNVQSLAEGEIVTEEFTYTVQDGDNDTASSTLTITITGTNDAPVIDSVVSDLSGFTFNGLNVEYYGVNSQLTNIAQFRGIVDNNDPDATFRGTEVSYSVGSGTVSQGENLQSFINSDAATLSADPGNASDGGLHMFGQVYLEAGTYVFKVRADDGYQVTVDGNSVGEFDGNQGPTTRTHSSFTIASDGYHDVDIVWWDQGGRYVFEPELSQDGGAFEVFSPANFEFKSDATSSVIEAGTTDSGAVVDGINSASGSMTATDVDNGAVLSWSVADGAGTYGMFGIDPISGQWTYTLDNAAADPLAEGETTTEQFTVIVTDEHGATDSEVVTITIQGTNDSPIAFVDADTTAENASITIDVLANDTDVDNNDNPSNFSLNNVSFAAGAAPTATVNIVANQLVFNPGTDFDYLPDGATATIIVNYTMSDDSGATSSSTVAITITGTNDAPIIQAESDFNAVEDAAVINEQVVATDIDSDDDSASLTYSIDGITPAGLIFNADGSYSFDPSDAAYQSLAAGETTTASFSWKATDSHGADSAIDAVIITITGTNDQPVVSDVGTQGITGAIVLNGALTTSVDYWNFTHNGGDLSIDMLTEISGANGQNGTNGVGYNEIDGDNSQTSLDVMIRVFSLNANGSRGAQVGVNDDNNNPGFDGSLYNRDSFLDLNNLPQGDYQLVVGAWNLTSAEVDSGINAVDSATWHFEGPYQITLHGENGAQLKAQGVAFEAVDGDTLFESVLPTVVDADLTDTHNYSLVAASETLSQSNPLGAPLAMPTIIINADGSYSVSGDFNSLALGETATVTFQYIADDLNGFDGTDGVNESSVSAPATVTITIQGTNDAPIAFVDTDSTTENAAITIDVLANDTDIDNGDDQAFSLDNVSFNSGVPAVPTATVGIVANQLVFDPGTDFDYLAVGESTTVVVNYTMSDDSGAASSSTATITITGTNDAPVIIQAVDANTVTGTHDGAVSLKIFIADLAGNIISEHDAIVHPDGTWTADFTKPTVGDYTMIAIAYDGPNGTGNASDVSNAINVNVGSTYQNIVDTDSAINIVFDGNASNTISTGSGDDVLVVNRGNDSFNTGAGDDKFIVEGTNKGSNQFNGGAGTDTIQGGAGDDIIGLANFTAGSSIEIIDGGAGTNSIQGSTYSNLDFSATTLLNIDEIRDGNGSNTITGNDQDTNYRVGRGNDTFNAGAGDDTFLVANNSGTNQFNGGAGTDTIQGEEGVDSVIKISATSSIEIVDGGLASDFNVFQGSTYSDLDLTTFTEFRDIDEVRDGNGSNTIIGRDDNTTYRVGRGNDTFNAGSGDDTFLVANNSGTNQFNGGAGTDTIQGEEGVDSVIKISATSSIEIVDGGLASDFNVFQGSTYSDLDLTTFTEFRDIDEVRDGNGSNTIIGRDDNTTYRVGRGNDTFNAGTGDDTFIVEGTNKGSNQFNGGAGNDIIQGGAGDDTIGLLNFNASNSIEVIDGGAGTNVIQGATYANLDFSTTTLLNIDEIRDGNGSNTITGNDQDTTYRVGRGNDTFNTGTGDDTFIVEGTNKGSNQFNGSAGNDTIQGGAGDDTIGLLNFNASNSIETIDGGAGNNIIQGSTYSDLDFSTTTLLNIDEIRGGNGPNTIIGSQGDDSINTGNGHDSITGGLGNDILTGGSGNDLFIWNSADVGVSGSPAHDEVTDFTGNTSNPGVSARDVLDLSDLLSDGSHIIEGLAENDASGPGQHLQLSIKDAATNSVVQTIDLNNVSVSFGDNTADMLNNLLANGGINDGI